MSPSAFVDLLFCQTKVLLSRDHTDGVGVALAAAPALDADNVVALVDDAELETMRNGPLETAINVLLPDLDVEVRLPLGEEERPDSAVKVGVLCPLLAERSTRHTSCQTYPRSNCVSGDHEDGADRAVLGEEAGGFTTINVRHAL